MKKLLILSIALLAAISCSTNTSDNNKVVITTLEGSSFSLSEFGVHTFPATDDWVIEDQSASASSFEGLSAAIEYISTYESDRQIKLTFSALTQVPAYAIFGVAINDGFRNFSSLSSLSAPYVVSIGDYAFQLCSGLLSIDFPLVESVGMYAFSGCSSIRTLDMPVVTMVDHAAFSGCQSLATLALPLVESLGDQAFRLCGSLNEVALPEVTSIGSAAFAYCSLMTSFEAPVLLSIGTYAFCEASALASLSIPLVEQIGDSAFIECDALSSFTITSLMTSLGAGLFNGCDALTEIVTENSDYLFDGGILYNADQTIAYEALSAVVEGDLVLPSSVLELGDRAFYDCAALISVELPSVVTIPYQAFAYCANLESVTLTAAKTLEAEAFYDCELVSTFSAPEVTVIGSRTFYNCDSFVDLSLATNAGVMLESIDLQAFYGAYTEDVILTVGEANASLVTYGDTLTVGDFEMEFPEIIVLEA